MSTREIFYRVATDEGWSDDDQIDILLRYIENQAADDSFHDYLVEQRAGPNSSREHRDPADDFLWKIAGLLQHADLAHNPDFQSFCGNAFGVLTAEQAADRWLDRTG